MRQLVVFAIGLIPQACVGLGTRFDEVPSQRPALADMMRGGQT